MAWTPLLLALLSHCTGRDRPGTGLLPFLLSLLGNVSVSAGSLSQPVLTQPPSLSASPGATARLTCTLSSGSNVGGYWIRWYQQKPGSSPRYLLKFYSDSDKGQGSGVSSRFSGSKDASVNAGLLTISGLQPEDEAVYYCDTWDSSSKTLTVAQTHRDEGSHGDIGG
uniref:Ig-like domain-containing protein n=1 Tax=Myotis lucifugus TaxID=59463 RepID=G1Q8Z4_MYOLU